MTEEKSSSNEATGAPSPTDRKYFVEAGAILAHEKAGPRRRAKNCAVIIDSSRVIMSEKRLRLPLLSNKPEEGDDIQVEVIREGERIKSIRIRCLCGRSAEFNCEYAGENVKR